MQDRNNGDCIFALHVRPTLSNFQVKKKEVLSSGTNIGREFLSIRQLSKSLILSGVMGPLELIPVVIGQNMGCTV